MITYTKNDYNPTEIVHPGATLEETLRSIGMTQSELAKRTNRPDKTISEIINGTTAITPETAIQFERALGIPGSFWNNLEKNYQEMKARLAAKEALQHEVEMARKYPIGLMVKRNWIKASKNIDEVVESLLGFFGVNSLGLISNVMDIAYRNHKGKNIYQEGLQVWLRKGEIDSAQIETKPYDEVKLKETLKEIRSYSNKSPQDYLQELREKLANCGVAIVFVPSIPKTYVCGTARWLSPNKALVQLSLRGGFADIMWFTLFHEIGHILLHGKKMKHIDFDGDDKKNNIEDEANDFASEQLIPFEEYTQFLNSNYANVSAIRSFANRVGIDPGIVVGRLQHDQKIEFKDFHQLRARYKFIEN